MTKEWTAQDEINRLAGNLLATKAHGDWLAELLEIAINGRPVSPLVIATANKAIRDWRSNYLPKGEPVSLMVEQKRTRMLPFLRGRLEKK